MHGEELILRDSRGSREGRAMTNSFLFAFVFRLFFFVFSVLSVPPCLIFCIGIKAVRVAPDAPVPCHTPRPSATAFPG